MIHGRAVDCSLKDWNRLVTHGWGWSLKVVIAWTATQISRTQAVSSPVTRPALRSEAWFLIMSTGFLIALATMTCLLTRRQSETLGMRLRYYGQLVQVLSTDQLIFLRRQLDWHSLLFSFLVDLCVSFINQFNVSICLLGYENRSSSFGKSLEWILYTNVWSIILSPCVILIMPHKHWLLWLFVAFLLPARLLCDRVVSWLPRYLAFTRQICD